MTRRYYQLYDVASDYTFIPVDGKSEYGDMAHAKKRANEIYKKKVTWGKKKLGMTFGAVDGQITFAIADKVRPQSFRSDVPMTKRKKNPATQNRERFLSMVKELRKFGKDELFSFAAKHQRGRGAMNLGFYGDGSRTLVGDLSNFAANLGAAKVTKGDTKKMYERIAHDILTDATKTEYKTRRKNPRKKNPEIEIRELILFSENQSSMYNQYLAIMKNLSRKKERGIYDPVLAAKLWKYWIDEGVKQYNKEVLGGGYSLRQNVFTVADRKQAAIEMEEQEQEEVFGLEYLHNPSRRKKKKATRKKNPNKEYVIFSYGDGDIRFAVNRGGKIGFSFTKGNAIRYSSRAKATADVHRIYRSLPSKRLLGVTDSRTTIPQLKMGTEPGK